jgi:F-type H+-transporting ATPase subunit alpha
MPEQVAVLLGLTAGLFDPVPLEKVAEAEAALRKATGEIPSDVVGRLATAAKLSDADRKVIVDLAARALSPFVPPPPAAKAPAPAKAAPNKPAPATNPPANSAKASQAPAAETPATPTQPPAAPGAKP